jgi:hypothetical protein
VSEVKPCFWSPRGDIPRITMQSSSDNWVGDAPQGSVFEITAKPGDSGAGPLHPGPPAALVPGGAVWVLLPAIIRARRPITPRCLSSVIRYSGMTVGALMWKRVAGVLRAALAEYICESAKTDSRQVVQEA